MWIKKVGITVTALWLLVAGCSASAVANDEVTAHEVVEQMTVKLVSTIDQYRVGFEQDPQPFYLALEGLLDEALDFKWISYNVMGYYRKQATPEQLDRFVMRFRRDLVETYGGGLVAFGQQDIVVLPPNEDLSGRRTVHVLQEIRGEDGNYPLQYTMGQKRSGEWKITNVIINGVNLGKTFRNQFIQRAQKFNGDLDRVIDDWSVSSESGA